MIANYHTHTTRCGHASGTEMEYAEAAVRAGLKLLGFSDHTPQIFPGDYYSNMRMRQELLEDYVQSVLAVREAYKGKLEVPLGVEAEYYPALFSDLLSLLRDHGVEYMILGQHYLDNEMGSAYAGKATEDPKLLERYCDQSIEAMHTGLFSYFAHPDLIRFAGEDDIYRRHVRRLCRSAKECGVPLEINLLGVRDERHYPRETFWEVAAEEGCTAILGVDAHSPETLLNTDAMRRGEELADRLGLRRVDFLELKKL